MMNRIKLGHQHRDIFDYQIHNFEDVIGSVPRHLVENLDTHHSPACARTGWFSGHGHGRCILRGSLLWIL